MSHGRRQRDRGVVVGDRAAGYRCLVRIRRGRVSESCHFGADQAWMHMLTIHSWALARGVLGVGDHRNGPDGAEDPRDPRIVVEQPPRRTCILGVLMLGAAV